VYCHVLMGHNVRIIHPVGCRCQLSGFKRSLCILYLILSALFAVSNHLSHFRIDWRHQRVPENPTAGIGYTPERLFGGGVGVVQGVYLPRHISRQELLLCGCPSTSIDRRRAAPLGFDSCLFESSRVNVFFYIHIVI